jgi:hypothetical protein
MNVKDLRFTIKADYPPPPPCPPLRTSSARKNKKIDEEFGKTMDRWNKDFKEWKKAREENVINNRFEILDL